MCDLSLNNLINQHRGGKVSSHNSSITLSPQHTVSYRYPEARSEYTRHVGGTGEAVVLFALENLNYEVDWHHVNHNGVDFGIPQCSIGIEVWNWCDAHCYDDRTESAIEKLKPYEYKFVVSSYISEKTKVKLESDNITVIVTGFQVLPNDKAYRNFYLKHQGKKYLNDRTIKVVENLIRSYMPTKAYVYSIITNSTKSTRKVINDFFYSSFYNIEDMNLTFSGKIKPRTGNFKHKSKDSLNLKKIFICYFEVIE